MLKNMTLDCADFMSGNSYIRGKLDWVKPEFTVAVGSSDVYVGRLIALVGIEMKAIISDAQDCRHSLCFRKQSFFSSAKF
jgi:hypothetical protein